MRGYLALLCFTLFVVACQGFRAEDALVQETVTPEATVLPGGHVDDIIPHFQTGTEWAHADEARRAGYNRANDLFKKLNKEKYKAQGKKRKELNAKADKALMKLKEAKEAIQKKYARDDPSDFGIGEQTSADKANAKLAKTQKDLSTGRWGSSGDPTKSKWYGDGVISSDAYVDAEGHYLLGASRRRIGAGYGRRRRFVMPAAANGTDAEEMARAEKEHDMLGEEERELEKAKAEDEAEAGADTTAATEKSEESDEEDELPPGVHVAEKESISPEDKEALEATGAGANAEVDSTGHFTNPTDSRIIGQNATEELQPDGSPLAETELIAPLAH